MSEWATAFVAGAGGALVGAGVVFVAGVAWIMNQVDPPHRPSERPDAETTLSRIMAMEEERFEPGEPVLVVLKTGAVFEGIYEAFAKDHPLFPHQVFVGGRRNAGTYEIGAVAPVSVREGR